MVNDILNKLIEFVRQMILELIFVSEGECFSEIATIFKEKLVYKQQRVSLQLQVIRETCSERTGVPALLMLRLWNA